VSALTDTTPLRFFVPGLRCPDGRLTGRFMVREARPFSRAMVRKVLDDATLSSLPEAVRDATRLVLLAVVDDAQVDWILLASAEVLETAAAMTGDVHALPGGFYLLCTAATWEDPAVPITPA
jgi:hypothetical protein